VIAILAKGEDSILLLVEGIERAEEFTTSPESAGLLIAIPISDVAAKRAHEDPDGIWLDGRNPGILRHDSERAAR